MTRCLVNSLSSSNLLHGGVRSVVSRLTVCQNVCAARRRLGGVLRVVRSFSPTNVNTHDLRRYLLLRVREGTSSPLGRVRLSVVNGYYSRFAHGGGREVVRGLNVARRRCGRTIDSLAGLGPHPNDSLNRTVNGGVRRVVPSFVMRACRSSAVALDLGGHGIPRLHLDHRFARLLSRRAHGGSGRDGTSGSTLVFLGRGMSTTRNFVGTMGRQRRALLAAVRTVVSVRHPFFLRKSRSLLGPVVLGSMTRHSKLSVSAVSQMDGDGCMRAGCNVCSLGFFFDSNCAARSNRRLSIHRVGHVLGRYMSARSGRGPCASSRLTRALGAGNCPVTHHAMTGCHRRLGVPITQLEEWCGLCKDWQGGQGGDDERRGRST